MVGWSGWAAAGLTIGVVATQLDSSPGRFVASVQATTPLLLPMVLVVFIFGVWRNRGVAVANAAALTVLGAFLLAVASSTTSRRADPSATAVRVASVNLLDTNDAISAAVDDIAEVDADIIGLLEVNEQGSSALAEHPYAAEYPFKISLAGHGPTRGRAVWSKYPISEEPRNSDGRYLMTLVAQTPDGPVRVILAHIPSPLRNDTRWSNQLGRIPRVVATSDLPTVVMGDFNASSVHPPFRAMMSEAGLTDGLPAAGKRFTMTWPTNSIVPPFVALDHVLVTDRLGVVGGGAFDVTGSDHAGVFITFAAVSSPAS